MHPPRLATNLGSIGRNAHRLAAALLWSACAWITAPQIASAETSDANTIAAYIEANHKAPEAYIIDKFKERDVIFLGESHYVAHNLEFLQGLLPVLHRAGVYTLVWEFANYRNQDKLDRLITGDSYDEQLAKEIIADWYTVGFAYTGYTDVYRAAWRLNKSLPKHTRPFRIVAVNTPEPIEKMEPGKTSNYDVRNRAYGGSFYHEINYYWEKVIDKEVIQKNEKALVYAGAGHTSTRFYSDRKRPKGSGLSAGNFVYDYIGPERVLSINLHGSIGGIDVGKTIEKAIESLPEHMQRAGVDTRETPLGDMSAHARGYLSEKSKSSDFTLADVTDGYIYLGAPLCDARSVSAIPNFTDETILPILQQKYSVYEPRDKPYTAKEFDAIRAEKLETYWAGQRKNRFQCEE